MWLARIDRRVAWQARAGKTSDGVLAHGIRSTGRRAVLRAFIEISAGCEGISCEAWRTFTVVAPGRVEADGLVTTGRGVLTLVKIVAFFRSVSRKSFEAFTNVVTRQIATFRMFHTARPKIGNLTFVDV